MGDGCTDGYAKHRTDGRYRADKKKKKKEKKGDGPVGEARLSTAYTKSYSLHGSAAE